MLIVAFAVIGLQIIPARAQLSKTERVAPITDLTLEVVDLDPPSGSTLMANEPIMVRFRYKYARPNIDLRVWAKILDETYKPTYQGSIDSMTPGIGTLSRFVYLTEPGTVNAITLVVKDGEHRQIYARDFKVKYHYIRNARAEKMKDEGIGSSIANVRFSPVSPAVLKVGATVEMYLDYDINTANGLDMSAEPVTNCNMTYSGMTGREHGKGRIRKTFSVGEVCVIKKIKIVMVNAANRHVFEKIIDVDFNFAK